MLLTKKEYVESYIKECAYIETCEKYNVNYLNDLKGLLYSFAKIELENLIEKYLKDDNLIWKYSFYHERMINGEMIVYTIK
jgi:hypothetical protein